MAVRRLLIDEIVIGQRQREMDPAAVAELAQSMAEIGLKYPISVRYVEVPPDDECPAGGAAPKLTAGLHRLEAARSLGWEFIDCDVTDGDERQAVMWEISENLHRRALTGRERAKQLRLYAKLLEQIPAPLTERLANGRKRGPQHQKQSIVSRVADATGLPRKAVWRALRQPDAGRAPEHGNVRRNRLMEAWAAASETDRAWFIARVADDE